MNGRIHCNNKNVWCCRDPLDKQARLEVDTRGPLDIYRGAVDSSPDVWFYVPFGFGLTPRQMRSLAKWLLDHADEIEAKKKPRKARKRKG